MGGGAGAGEGALNGNGKSDAEFTLILDCLRALATGRRRRNRSAVVVFSDALGTRGSAL